MTPNRNNDAIFNQLSYWPSINFGFLSIWTFAFQRNNKTGFSVALLIIITMLFTSFVILDIASKNRL